MSAVAEKELPRSVEAEVKVFEDSEELLGEESSALQVQPQSPQQQLQLAEPGTQAAAPAIPRTVVEAMTLARRALDTRGWAILQMAEADVVEEGKIAVAIGLESIEDLLESVEALEQRQALMMEAVDRCVADARASRLLGLLAGV